MMASFQITKLVLLFSILLALFASTSAHLQHRPRYDDEDVYATSAEATTTTAAPNPTSVLSQRPQADAFNFNLTYSLPRASSTLKSLDVVPASCTSYQPGECTATMTATNVTFDDCGDSWTFCRCSDAKMSLDEAVDRFARVPTGLRRYVGTVIVLGDSTPTCHAYTLTTGDIHLFNDCQMETFLHESTHAYDFASGTGISRSDGWLNAIKQDSCVPDNYSQTNPTEDFAQMGVIKVYEMARGELPPGFESDCMENQLEFMDNLPLYDEDTLFGNTCDIPDTEGYTGARKVDPPKNLNTTKVFPIPDAPPVDFASVSASVEAAENQVVATATPSVSATPSATPSLFGRPVRNPAFTPDNAGFAVRPPAVAAMALVIAAVAVF